MKEEGFSFVSPRTPHQRKERRLAQESASSESGDSNGGYRRSPLLANVSMSLTDWLPLPDQTSRKFAETRLRWAVRTKDWQPSLKEWAFMLTLLPQYDQDQIAGFKFLEDRKRRLISCLLQRKCINVALGVKWSQIRIRRTKGKKPWVVCDDIAKDHAPNFNFNVSHEGDYVVLSSEPICICGIDVSAPRQYRGQRRPTLEAMLESTEGVFTTNEIAAMKKAGDTNEERLEAFRRCWSLKEALGKARGDGLGMDFRRAEFDIFQDIQGWRATVRIDGVLRPNWRFNLLKLAGGHWMSVSRGPPEDIIDAWGDFADSLELPSPPFKMLQEALDAPNPPLSILQPIDLLPSHKVMDYQAIMEAQ